MTGLRIFPLSDIVLFYNRKVILNVGYVVLENIDQYLLGILRT